jgi:hypothetical protein
MRLSIAVLLLAVAPVVAAQDAKKEADPNKEADKKPVDKVGSMKAPNLATKSGAEAQKRKGAAISLKGVVAGFPREIASTFDGILRKDFAGARGSQEIYAKGAQYLVKAGDSFLPPSEVSDGRVAADASSFKNPSIILGEVSQLAAAASYGADDAVGGEDCKLLLLDARPLIKPHLKEFGERMSAMMRQGPGGGFFGGGNFASYLDEKVSTSDFQVWVAKSDLLPRKLLWTLKPKMKAQGLPPGVPRNESLEVRTEVTFSKWDEEVPFDIHNVVKQKWGLK